MAEVLLYGAWRSTCTHRVVLALNHLGFKYQYIPVDLDKREQEQDGFLQVNPAAQVPALVAGDLKLSQSLAIVTYLESATADKSRSLFPLDPKHRAFAVEIAERVSSFIQPFVLPGAVRRRLMTCLSGETQSTDIEQALGRFVKEQMTESLQRLDRRLAEVAGRYCVGDQLSVADIFVVPQLVGAARLGIDVNGFPTLSRVYETCTSQPLFKNSDPSLLPDAPGNRGAAGASSNKPNEAPSVSTPAAAVQPAGVSAALAYKEPDHILSQYLETKVNKPLPELEFVRAEAFRRFGPVATKVSALEVCFFLRWLAQVIQARRAIEIGVFTGSSSLALLDGMGPDGSLDAFDISAEYTEVATEAWKRAGFAERARLHLVDAIEGLTALRSQSGTLGSYDLAYVDGSNLQYQACHEALLPLMRRGGLIVFDNVLWKGRVASGDTSDPSSVHLRELNAALRDDRRVENTIISLGDGLALSIVK